MNNEFTTENRSGPGALTVREALLRDDGLDNAYLVHDTADVGFVPAGYAAMLTDAGKENFSELLGAAVKETRRGAYGTEFVLAGIDPQALVDFDRAAASYERGEPGGGFFEEKGLGYAGDISFEGVTVRLHNENMNWWLGLPAGREELQRALSEMGAEDGGFTIDRYRDGFGGRLEPLLEGGGLSELNYLAARLEGLEPEHLRRLAAVMESPERFESIGKLIDFTYNTGHYDLFTEVHSREDLARHSIYDSGLVQIPEEWAEGIDLQKFGANMEKHEAGHYTAQGYLTPSGVKWEPVFEKGGVVPEEYRLTPDGIPANESRKPVYTRSVDYAREHGELDLWRESRDLNAACARAVDQAVKDSNYELYRYDLEGAAKAVVAEFGAERVSWALAGIVQANEYDGRYSSSNKAWAKEFDIPGGREVFCNTHPVVLDGFIGHARKIMEELQKDAGLRFDAVHGYEIRQAVLFENDRGFALAENPNAPSPFVTWQYTEENGAKDFYWGHYFSRGDSAREDFSERVAGYKEEYGFAEKYNYLAAAEMSAEQNYNMIDGRVNNEPAPKADLTDGQTYEEIVELAPETLPEEKQSVVGKIREARDNPRPVPEAPEKKQTRSHDERTL